MNTPLQSLPENLIVGLGATGLSVAQYFSDRQIDFAVLDQNNNLQQIDKLKMIDAAVPVVTGKFNSSMLSQAKKIVVSPGVSIHSPAIKKAAESGVEITGDIEIFAKEVKKYSAKVVAVTGSNGKSTCVSLLTEMAKKSGVKVKLGGNIGTPALDLLKDDSADLYVLELSSFQLETTNSLMCDVACVLNFSRDHLDRYENYTAYILAKKKLLNQTKRMVFFGEDEEIAKWGLHKNTHNISFSLGRPKTDMAYGITIKNKKEWLCRGDKNLMSVEKIKLTGRHNLANVLAAWAMGDVLGLDAKAMRLALEEFSGLPHRSQFVANIQGVDWINDSKATNVGAAVSSILGLVSAEENTNIILLAGGQTKNADLSELKQVVGQFVKKVILFGEDANLLLEVLADASACSVVKDLSVAVDLARDNSVSGDVVLLAPAGASFDQFENFAVRGQHFIALVEGMT